ncbi:hypothetical protein [Alkalihalobacillus sp. CinArs1]|uniref:hypothetical protein n=1 Tax=Alkalihalobacillus sp. CinArs1 TaxID=2995314 RepID=UPI0022DDDE11|nr:hypothetical protein [Alkalihalobacillus sp. CinArs1]
MSEDVLKKIRLVLFYIGFLIIAVSVSYFIAYPVGFAPNGYELIESTEDKATLQTYTIMGMKDEEITYRPEEENEWKITFLSERIDQLPQDYFFFFTSVTVAIFWAGIDFIRRRSLKRSLLQAGAFMLFPTLTLVGSINDIKDVIQHSL